MTRTPGPGCACGSAVLHHGMSRSLAAPPSLAAARAPTLMAATQTSNSPMTKDTSSALSLANIRDALIKLEDTIIFSLIERSQFMSNDEAYVSGGIPVPGFCKGGRQYSFLEWLLLETEQVHGKIRRYTSPDEHPFFPDELPSLVLPPLEFPSVLAPFSDEINYNPQIMRMYLEEVIPAVTRNGSDNNHGSSCLIDVTLLQALSKRIHYGKFVAEAKFLAQTEEYTGLIRTKDADGIMALLTDLPQEERVIERVRRKAGVFGQDVGASADNPVHKVDPEAVASLYKDWLMPLTKDVEVDYLLRRLEWDRR